MVEEEFREATSRETRIVMVVAVLKAVPGSPVVVAARRIENCGRTGLAFRLDKCPSILDIARLHLERITRIGVCHALEVTSGNAPAWHLALWDTAKPDVVAHRRTPITTASTLEAQSPRPARVNSHVVDLAEEWIVLDGNRTSNLHGHPARLVVKEDVDGMGCVPRHVARGRPEREFVCSGGRQFDSRVHLAPAAKDKVRISFNRPCIALHGIWTGLHAGCPCIEERPISALPYNCPAANCPIS